MTCTCITYAQLGPGVPFLDGTAARLVEDFNRDCAEHGALRCFVTGCTSRVAFTKSWLEGVTVHSCLQHEPLLPEKKPDGQLRQAVLI